MSSKFSLQAPYTIASLPRPIDHLNGQYVVGDVLGGVLGSKKRKRSELVVGIDGEGVNLYDIPSSKLITSYALPPQTAFACPPTSLRIKLSKSKIERRTYVSTTRPQSEITLFTEIEEGASHHVATTSRTLENTKPVVFLGTVTAARGSDTTENTSDLLIVKEDGEVQCLDGSNLQEKWISPASALRQDSAASTTDFIVEFTHLTNAHAASQCILKGRQDVLDLFQQEISEDGFNPDLLFIITKSSNSRTVQMVTLPRRSASHSKGFQHMVENVLSVDLPTTKYFSPKASFSLQVSTGALTQLSKGKLITFDLSHTLPRETSQIQCPSAESFLRLSSTSVIVSSKDTLSVYNPKFHSILASTQLDSRPVSESLKRKRVALEETNGIAPHACKLVAYFPKLGTAVGIQENELVGLQVQSQGKGRAPGLLIDSLGCAIPGQKRSGHGEKNMEIGLSTIKSYLPSYFTDGDETWEERIRPLEAAFTSGNAQEFDSLLLKSIGNMSENAIAGKSLVNGTALQKSQVPQSSAEVDRRWIIYALRKIFTLSADEKLEGPRLSVAFYPQAIFTWLLQTGNMTVSNIESALIHELRTAPFDTLPAGQLVHALYELDPEINFLHVLVTHSYLGAAELLQAIRQVMDSLDVLGNNAHGIQGLLSMSDDTDLTNGDLEEHTSLLEAQASEELELAEYQLNFGSRVRADTLSLALSKLYTCPSRSIISALQTTFSTADVAALIYLLRLELARGAWTTRYLDVAQSDIVDQDADTQDNSIGLISSLLNNCVDAVGAGGWLSGDARLVDKDPFEAEELIKSLKLEVSAALEGVQEAVYLRGLTSEMIRYGGSVQGGLQSPEPPLPAGKKRTPKPVLLPSSEHDMKTLPLGLKADQQISLMKVGAGGEISHRTRRDIGHLKSQKVAKYSLERIIV